MDPVLIINLSKWFGGADIRVLEIARALEGQYPYGVVTLKDSPLHKKLVAAKLNALPLSFCRQDPQLALAIYRIIKRSGYKIIDMHNPQSHMWGIIAAKLAGLPSTITTVHSSRDMTAFFLKNLLYEKVLQINSQFGSHFIAVSQSVKKYLLQLNARPERISLITNGIAIPELPANHHRLSVRRSFGWQANNFVLITVGRLEPIKGHIYLLDAIKSVVDKHPHIRCLFVGEGRERKSLKSYAQKNQLTKYVHFAGFREDISSLLSASDLFCLPSLSEGLPYAMLEASSCRLPLLVTEVGGLTEFLKDDESALMVPPKNPKAMAKGLLKLIESPHRRRRLANTAFHNVQHRFSVEQMVAKTLSAYAGSAP